MKFLSFYCGPIAITSVFSVMFYPYCVYGVKKLLKFKNFWSVNLSVIPILLFFNIRVYALSQTYIGFKFIESNYNSVNSKKRNLVTRSLIKNNQYENYGEAYNEALLLLMKNKTI